MFVHKSGSVDRPAIVFLHGDGTNGTLWKTHMERLADYYCLAPDFPGFGQSRDQEWVSIDETVNQVIDVIRDHTKHAKAHIVGLSLGGITAIKLLSKAPDLLDRAIVDGAGVLPIPGLPLMKVGLRILQPFLHTDFVLKTVSRSLVKIPDDGYEDFKQGMLSVSPSTFTRSIIQANSVRQPPGLEKVTCPVLFVAGEKDPKTTLQSNDMLAEIMPNASSRMVPGLGHGWMTEKMELHVRMVEAWINDEPLPKELVEVEL